MYEKGRFADICGTVLMKITCRLFPSRFPLWMTHRGSQIRIFGKRFQFIESFQVHHDCSIPQVRDGMHTLVDFFLSRAYDSFTFHAQACALGTQILII